MGQKLLEFFDEAKAKGGLKAQVKLAMLTKMTRNKAQEAEDSSENVQIFKNAIKELG